MTTIKTTTDSSATGFLLVVLFTGVICLLGVIYNNNLADTGGATTGSSTLAPRQLTDDALPCFAAQHPSYSTDKCTSTGSSWAVLCVQRGKEHWELNGLTACNNHKSDAELVVNAKIASNHVKGRGSFYLEVIHVSDFPRYEETRRK